MVPVETIISLIKRYSFPARQTHSVLQKPIDLDGATLVPSGKLKHDGRPVAGAEIGCAECRVTSALLDEFPGLTMYAVDSFCEDHDGDKNESQSGKTERNELAIQAVSANHNRCIVLSCSSKVALDRLRGRKFDFVIIDGNPDEVSSDAAMWWPNVIDGGLMIFLGLNDGENPLGVKLIHDSGMYVAAKL